MQKAKATRRGKYEGFVSSFVVSHKTIEIRVPRKRAIMLSWTLNKNETDLSVKPSRGAGGDEQEGVRLSEASVASEASRGKQALFVGHGANLKLFVNPHLPPQTQRG
jgi:hypothetical protein